MNYNYYYNQVPRHGPQRNNLIYTSLMSDDCKTFVQWFYNDTEYHRGQNEVVDDDKMEEKWQREVKYLTLMSKHYPELVPEVLDIDVTNRKIYLRVDGVDFWNRASCQTENYDSVLQDWKSQMLTIIKAHKSLDLYKYSMHPSSYFVVDNQLKSINYFFVYHESEGPISIAEHSSHIHSSRQAVMRQQIEKLGISWDKPESLSLLQHLCFESFKTNYPKDFIKEAEAIYDQRN